MKKKTTLLLAILFCILTTTIPALPIDIDIYSDTTISGGEYGTINVYDSPPKQTTITFVLVMLAIQRICSAEYPYEFQLNSPYWYPSPRHPFEAHEAMTVMGCECEYVSYPSDNNL
jgi:hypothetical protein